MSGSTQPPETSMTPPESHTGELLTDLLGLIHEQVRVELQSQQTIAGQDAVGAGSTSQQALGTATTELLVPTVSGTV